VVGIAANWQSKIRRRLFLYANKHCYHVIFGSFARATSYVLGKNVNENDNCTACNDMILMSYVNIRWAAQALSISLEQFMIWMDGLFRNSIFIQFGLASILY